jgi:hypothetical protein
LNWNLLYWIITIIIISIIIIIIINITIIIIAIINVHSKYNRDMKHILGNLFHFCLLVRECVFFWCVVCVCIV